MQCLLQYCKELQAVRILTDLSELVCFCGMEVKHMPELGASTEFACARESESAPTFERREPLDMHCCHLDLALLSRKYPPAQAARVSI